VAWLLNDAFKGLITDCDDDVMDEVHLTTFSVLPPSHSETIAKMELMFMASASRIC
jgi:hypothetical protein